MYLNLALWYFATRNIAVMPKHKEELENATPWKNQQAETNSLSNWQSETTKQTNHINGENA